MIYEAINFKQKLNSFKEQWSPKVIAKLNDYEFKVAKLGDVVDSELTYKNCEHI